MRISSSLRRSNERSEPAHPMLLGWSTNRNSITGFPCNPWDQAQLNCPDGYHSKCITSNLANFPAYRCGHNLFYVNKVRSMITRNNQAFYQADALRPVSSFTEESGIAMLTPSTLSCAAEFDAYEKLILSGDTKHRPSDILNYRDLNTVELYSAYVNKEARLDYEDYYTDINRGRQGVSTWVHLVSSAVMSDQIRTPLPTDRLKTCIVYRHGYDSWPLEGRGWIFNENNPQGRYPTATSSQILHLLRRGWEVDVTLASYSIPYKFAGVGVVAQRTILLHARRIPGISMDTGASTPSLVVPVTVLATFRVHQDHEYLLHRNNATKRFSVYCSYFLMDRPVDSSASLRFDERFSDPIFLRALFLDAFSGEPLTQQGERVAVALDAHLPPRISNIVMELLFREPLTVVRTQHALILKQRDCDVIGCNIVHRRISVSPSHMHLAKVPAHLSLENDFRLYKEYRSDIFSKPGFIPAPPGERKRMVIMRLCLRLARIPFNLFYRVRMKFLRTVGSYERILTPNHYSSDAWNDVVRCTAIISGRPAHDRRLCAFATCPYCVHVCPYCPGVFGQSCKRAFRTAKGLRRHIKSVHIGGSRGSQNRCVISDGLRASRVVEVLRSIDKKWDSMLKVRTHMCLQAKKVVDALEHASICVACAEPPRKRARQMNQHGFFELE